MRASKIYVDLFEKMKAECDNFDDTIDYLDKCIEENPNFLEAYLMRGEVHEEMGDYQMALEDIEKAIKINPNEAAVYNSRGRIHVISGGDINQAFKDFSKAIELNPIFVDAYCNRANVYLKMREPQKAIIDCNKAIQISPNEYAEPYINRGLAYMNLEEPELLKALDDYNKVINIDPENAEAYARRGVINQQLGNIQEAISDYEEFLRLDPNNKNAQLTRDELKQLKSGKTESFNEPVNKERRLLYICSAICFVIGTIIGASDGNIPMGMWFGIGCGVAFSFFPDIPYIFKNTYRNEGFSEALKTTFVGGGIWFLIFMVAGPIGFIIRFLKTK